MLDGHFQEQTLIPFIFSQDNTSMPPLEEHLDELSQDHCSSQSVHAHSGALKGSKSNSNTGKTTDGENAISTEPLKCLSNKAGQLGK